MASASSESNENVARFVTGNADIRKEGVLDILRYTHFLGQHSIRDFIYGSRRDSDKKITTTRYDLLAEMFGFGEVEQLKKRLTKVLAQVQRKVTEAENRMSEARDQIRALQKRYPEKSRKDLHGKGYEIKPQPTIQKYDQLMGDLASLLPSRDIRVVTIGDKPLMEDYLESCRKLKTVLNAEGKRLEAQASDLKRFGRLMARLRSMLPESILLDLTSTVKIIEGTRQYLDSSLEKIRNDEREVDTMDRRASALKDRINSLEVFLERYDRYLQILKTEKQALGSFASVQERRNELLNRQSGVLDRLTQATSNERKLERSIADKEQLLGRYARWLTSIPEIRTAELTLQDYEHQISEVTDAIDQTEKRLAELQKTLGPHYISQVTPESVLNLESLRTDNDYYCPCCGKKYVDKTDLEHGMKSQLVRGKYGKELRRFLIELERSNSESLRSHLLETLKTHNDEIAKFQNLAAEQRAILAGFSRISEQFDAVQTQSEDEVRQAYIEQKSQGEQMHKTLANHEAKQLRKEAEEIRLALTDLQYEERERHLSEVRREISELTKPIVNLTDLKGLGSVDVLQSSLNLLRDELLALNVKRDRLLTGIKEADLSPRRVREVDEILGELETLNLTQETLRDQSPGQADFLTTENLSKQATNYKLASDVDDLSKLFGLLTVDERTGSLTASLKTHNDNIARWSQCYENFESMSASLSSLSHVGLQKSLDEYGPVINQIYQKFIRHDIFAALVLRPKVSRKGFKHDLYLRLRRYSGEEEYTPASYLSEAQLNILALSIFLTRARYQRISVLDTIFIDDPIQQMDDMNAAAFVDVVVGLSQIGKQIIITTYDQDFFRLVAYKMRSVADTGRVSFKTLNLDSTTVH
jgi:DNA repair exonuclease SbcCD ATPase subunit